MPTSRFPRHLSLLAIAGLALVAAACVPPDDVPDAGGADAGSGESLAVDVRVVGGPGGDALVTLSRDGVTLQQVTTTNGTAAFDDIDLAAGPVTVTAALAGYALRSVRGVAIADEPVRITLVASGTVNVGGSVAREAGEDAVAVWIDGRPVAATPTFTAEVPVGSRPHALAVAFSDVVNDLNLRRYTQTIHRLGYAQPDPLDADATLALSLSAADVVRASETLTVTNEAAHSLFTTGLVGASTMVTDGSATSFTFAGFAERAEANGDGTYGVDAAWIAPFDRVLFRMYEVGSATTGVTRVFRPGAPSDGATTSFAWLEPLDLDAPATTPAWNDPIAVALPGNAEGPLSLVAVLVVDGAVAWSVAFPEGTTSIAFPPLPDGYGRDQAFGAFATTGRVQVRACESFVAAPTDGIHCSREALLTYDVAL